MSQLTDCINDSTLVCKPSHLNSTVTNLYAHITGSTVSYNQNEFINAMRKNITIQMFFVIYANNLQYYIS